MAKRGRPRKSTTELTKMSDATLLKRFQEEQKVQLETFYTELAVVKKKIDLAITHIGLIDEAESLSQAAFKAGKAYGPLDEANDKLEEMLDNMYENNNFKLWEDINEN